MATTPPSADRGSGRHVRTVEMALIVMSRRQTTAGPRRRQGSSPGERLHVGRYHEQRGRRRSRNEAARTVEGARARCPRPSRAVARSDRSASSTSTVRGRRTTPGPGPPPPRSSSQIHQPKAGRWLFRPAASGEPSPVPGFDAWPGSSVGGGLALVRAGVEEKPPVLDVRQAHAPGPTRSLPPVLRRCHRQTGERSRASRPPGPAPRTGCAGGIHMPFGLARSWRALRNVRGELDATAPGVAHP